MVPVFYTKCKSDTLNIYAIHIYAKPEVFILDNELYGDTCMLFLMTPLEGTVAFSMIVPPNFQISDFYSLQGGSTMTMNA